MSTKGRKASPETIEKLRKSHLGHTHTPETRAKMSATRKGRKRSPEECEAISKGQKKRYEDNPIPKFLALGDTITKELLFEKYVVEGKPAREIAEEFRVSNTTILRYLHWYDIPVRPSSRDPNFKHKEDRSENYRRIVFDNLGFDKKCELCGAVDNIHVHHKDRNRANNAKENIMVLCLSCHTYVHWRYHTYNGIQFKVPKGEPKYFGEA